MDEKQQERFDSLKGKTARPSARPMGTIYPGKIQKVMHGEDIRDLKFFIPGKNEDANTVRKVGDTWVDKDGYVWEQMNGWVRKHRKIEHHGVPMFCPKCNRIMKHRIDDKTFYIHGECMKCTAKRETQMRIDGTWDEYNRQNIRKNKVAYLKDIKGQMEDYIKREVKPKLDFHNEDGGTEEWVNESYEKQLEFFNKELEYINDMIEKLELVISGEKTEDEVFPIKEKKDVTAE